MPQIAYKPIVWQPDPDARGSLVDQYTRPLAHGIPTPPNGLPNYDYQPYQNLGYPWPSAYPLGGQFSANLAPVGGGGQVQGSDVLMAGGPGNNSRWGADAIRRWLLGVTSVLGTPHG